MNEWYDSQKKPNSNFRKLLQERIDEDNPRRKLSAEEERRLSKLKAVVAKLKRGENVQNRQLQTWLSEDALEIRQEIVASDASLQIWFDRHLDFEHGSLIDASLGNLPRLVTSRSIEKQHDDSSIVKKIDVKIDVVERVINNIDRAVESMTSSAKLQLNKFLQIDD